jgi:hypothetical protein
MNQIFWDFWSYETNPRNESLENRPTKRIHDTNLWKFRSRNKSTKRIFKVRIRQSGFANPPAWIRKDLFCAIVLRIRQDSWGFVKTARIFASSGHETNPRFKSNCTTLKVWKNMVNPELLLILKMTAALKED